MSTSKRVIDPFKIIDAGDISGNITSAATVVRNMDMVTFFVDWAGTDIDGLLTFQYVKKESLNPALEEWDTIDFGTQGQDIPITLNGSHTIIFTKVPFIKMRAVYTAVAGTGNITVTIVGKEG